MGIKTSMAAWSTVLVAALMLPWVPSLAVAWGENPPASVEAPVLPPDAEEGGTQIFMCEDGGVWVTHYNTYGDPGLSEIVVRGRTGSKVPLAWAFFAPDTPRGLLYIVLTIPGRPVQKVSNEQFKAMFPNGLCDIPVPTEA